MHIAWRHLYDDSIRDIAVASSVNDGQTFSPPQRIHADAWQIEGCPHTGPAVMSDDAGRLHVAWYSGAPASTGVWYAVRERGAEAFSLPVAVQRDLPVAQVSLAAMPDGPILVWEDPLARRVHARRMDGYTGADYVTSGLLPSAVGSVAGWALVTSSEDTIQLLAWTD